MADVRPSSACDAASAADKRADARSRGVRASRAASRPRMIAIRAPSPSSLGGRRERGTARAKGNVGRYFHKRKTAKTIAVAKRRSRCQETSMDKFVPHEGGG